MYVCMSTMKSFVPKVAFSPSTPIRFTSPSACSSFLPRVTTIRPFSHSNPKTPRKNSIYQQQHPKATTSASLSPSTSTSTSTSQSNGVRVRFAPSPTGALHVGGARTALYNWIVAKQTNGKFIVRVEDTDLERSTRESEEMVLSDLKWLGLNWDEGPDDDKECGPYRQSERSEIYKKYATLLMKQGKAYPCFCTEAELEKKRKLAESEGKAPQYDGMWRDADPELVQKHLDAGDEYTVRFKVPRGSRVIIDDAVRGKVAWDANQTVGDFIILRSNGIPVYNFCVAVDDALMQITTVIRAEEHLTNTLRQVLILKALNFNIPTYAHCSLILGKDRSKLSKRHGATSVTQFKLDGYLPAAMINYLAALGWSDGSEKDIYSVDELIESFDVKRITKSPAMFDEDKLRFINAQHLRALPFSDFQPLIINEWLKSNVFLRDRIHIQSQENDDMTAEQKLGVCAFKLVQGSVQLIADANQQMLDVLNYPLTETVVVEPEDSVKALIETDGGFKEVAACVLRDYDAGIMPTGKDGEDHIALWKKWVKSIGKEQGRKGKHLFHPLRLALTGSMSGPDVGAILEVLYLSEQLDAAPTLCPLNARIEGLRHVLNTAQF